MQSEPIAAAKRYQSTTVRRVRLARLAELRALALAALEAPLRWRHHAVGMLQAYVREEREPEVRIHLWHHELVRTDLAIDGGRPHDHRFRLRSTVLAGAVDHEELHTYPVAEGEPAPWREYTVQHARAGAAPLVATGRRLRALVVPGTIRAGRVYEFPARAFHRSTPRGLAVTLVTKVGQGTEPARVLFPEGCAPVFGVAPVEEATAARFVELARRALESADD